MSVSHHRWLLLAALVAVAPGAAAQGGVIRTAQPTATDEIEAIYRARADSARLRFTPADVEFMTGMIGHHAQAVRISRWAESHGASPTIRVLAGRIINAQLDEIAIMRQWLRDRGQPVPASTDSANAAGGMGAMAGMDHAHGHDDHALMPGMLTAAQLAELDAARGTDFDRLFLTLMIQHHRGATAMVSKLFAIDGTGQDEAVFKFASDVNVDQTTEIARMELMLAALVRPAEAK